MKSKKLTPRNAAPVQRENTATVSREGNAMIAPQANPGGLLRFQWTPFAGDDAE